MSQIEQAVAHLKAIREALGGAGLSADLATVSPSSRAEKLADQLMALPDTPELQRRHMVEGLRMAMLASGAELDRQRLERVLDAMLAVPREYFVHADAKPLAYLPARLAIGHEQTISHPQMVAAMLYGADLHSHDRVLDVGTGCGYQAAVLSRLVAHVSGIERIGALATDAVDRLARLGYRNVTVRGGDGRLAPSEESGFDAILVAAAAGSIPAALLRGLVKGGRLIMPVGDQGRQQLLVVVRRGEDEWMACSLGSASFVPLAGISSADDWSPGDAPLCLGASITVNSDEPAALPMAMSDDGRP